MEMGEVFISSGFLSYWVTGDTSLKKGDGRCKCLEDEQEEILSVKAQRW